MTKNRCSFIGLILSMALICAGALTPGAANGADETKEKVAVVNGVAIPSADLNLELSQVNDRASRSGRPIPQEQYPAVKKQILETLIDRELLYQECKSRNIEAPEDQVSDRLENMKRQISQNKALADRLERLGIDEASMKIMVERGMMIQALINQEFMQKIEISEEDVKSYYEANPESFKQPERIRARHILIKVAPDADEGTKKAARTKIEEIETRLKKGADFAEEAKAHSEGPTKVRGGDLGFFQRGQMVKPFDDAAFALEPGETSGVVETSFGFHLIRLEEKKPAGKAALAEVRPKLMDFLKQQELQKQLQKFVGDLKDKASIERLL